MTVTSSVSPNCTVQTSALDFGSYDPFSNTPLFDQTTITVRCTKGTANTLAIGNGLNDAQATIAGAQHAMASTGGGHLDYRFCQDSACASPIGGSITTPGTTTTVVDTVYPSYAAAAASGLPLHIEYPSYWPTGVWASYSTVGSPSGGTQPNEAEVTQLFGEVFARQDVNVGSYADSVEVTLTF